MAWNYVFILQMLTMMASFKCLRCLTSTFWCLLFSHNVYYVSQMVYTRPSKRIQGLPKQFWKLSKILKLVTLVQRWLISTLRYLVISRTILFIFLKCCTNGLCDFSRPSSRFCKIFLKNEMSKSYQPFQLHYCICANLECKCIIERWTKKQTKAFAILN